MGVYIINVPFLVLLSALIAVPISLLVVAVVCKNFVRSHKKILMTIMVVYIVVLACFLTVVYCWRAAITPGDGTPTLTIIIEKDNNNWTCLVAAPSRPGLSIYPATFTIKRGNLILVSFTFNDKQPGDPTNISLVDPITNNITCYNVYVLMREGYTLYFYDSPTYEDGKGNFTGGDKIYIVNNGLRSGDIFEIWYTTERSYTCIISEASLP